MATPEKLDGEVESKAAHDGRAASPCVPSTWLSRGTTIVYVLVALAAPALVHWGPDVLSPTAPEIAAAARDGRLALPAHPLCLAAKTLAAGRHPTAQHSC